MGLASVGGGVSATTIDRKDPTFAYSGTVAEVRDNLSEEVKRIRLQVMRYA